MLKFFLISLIAGSGIIFGGLLSAIARDERRPGKKYFILLKFLSYFSIAIITAVHYININILISISSLILLSVIFVKRFHLELLYLAFAAFYILSFTDQSLHLIISSLIFFAGLPIGTLATIRLIKEKEVFIEKRLFIPYFLFVFVIAIRCFATLWL